MIRGTKFSDVRSDQRREFRRTRDSESASNRDRKSTRLNSSHSQISYAVFCLKKNKKQELGNQIQGTVKAATHHDSDSPHANVSTGRPATERAAANISSSRDYIHGRDDDLVNS